MAHDKVAIVTGGNGGIGLGMARGLAQAGAGLMIVGRDQKKSSAAVKELAAIGVKAAPVAADLTARRHAGPSSRGPPPSSAASTS